MSYVRQNAPTIPFSLTGRLFFRLSFSNFLTPRTFRPKLTSRQSSYSESISSGFSHSPSWKEKSSLRLLNVKACALIVPLGTSYHRNYPYLTYRQFFLLTVRILLQLLGDIMERINDTLVSLCMAVCGTDCCSVRKQ